MEQQPPKDTKVVSWRDYCRSAGGIAPVEQQPKQGKKLVSWREYRRYLGSKAGFFSLAGIVLFYGVIGALASLLMLILSLASFWRGDNDSVLLVSGIVAGVLSATLLQFTGRIAREYQELPAVEPVTSRNANRLPAEEILVRASQEPTLEQQHMLLRAASATEETPSEQLLRPSS